MTNPVIAFLDERKQTKLKKPGNKTREDIEQQFQLKDWLEDAANRAGQLAMVSHPGKFSHPDAKISAVLVTQNKVVADGLLRCGNVPVPEDVLGNAAALDVYAFLTVELSDGRPLLQHLLDDSAELRDILSVDDATYQRWKSGLLAMRQPDSSAQTDQMVKQVYFPVGDDYHLLSILTPSGLVTANRDAIREMKFSDTAKEAREARKKQEASEHSLDDLPGILKVKFGGTQPQNVSKLNSRNAGEAWLLPSLPPQLESKRIRFPNRDFFYEQLWDGQLKEFYGRMHRIFSVRYNNVNIRSARQYWYQCLFDWVFENAALLQRQPAGWSEAENIKISTKQKIWLDAANEVQRQQETDWKDEIIQQLIQWSVVTYRRMRKRAGDAADLGMVDEAAFENELRQYARSIEDSAL